MIRPRAFIIADQSPAILIAIVHASALARMAHNPTTARPRVTDQETS